MKRILSGVLASLLLIYIVQVAPVYAQDSTGGASTNTPSNDSVITGTSGSCEWSLDGTVLTISGSGKTNDYIQKKYNYTTEKYYWDTKETLWGTDITKVIIMPGVTGIGAGAFANCENLTSVVFADSLRSIGIKAFANCYGLEQIVVPDTVEEIGFAAFSGCKNLCEITLPFVGEKRTPVFSESREAQDVLFGYIFGDEAYDESIEIKQCFTIYTSSAKISTSFERINFQSPSGISSYLYEFYTTLQYETCPYTVTRDALLSESISNEVYVKSLQQAQLHTVLVKESESAMQSNGSLTWKTFQNTLYYTNGYPKDAYRQSYYIPAKLKKVTITNAERLYFGAFSFCSPIDEIYITNTSTKVSTNAFFGCGEQQIASDRWEYGVSKIYCPKGSALATYILNGNYRLSKANPLAAALGRGKYIAPESPAVLRATDTEVVLVQRSGMEYSLDEKTWTTNNVFSGLKPNTNYTFYQRYSQNERETAGDTVVIFASDASEGITITTNAPLCGISISSLPNKLTYLEAKETLNVYGGKLCLNYGADCVEEIDLTADMVKGFDNTIVGVQSLTVTYRGFSATFEVAIEGKKVSSISIATTPAKTTYIEGEETLDVTGGKLKVYYNNGTQEVIDLTPDMVSGFDNSKAGQQTLLVTYAGKTCTYLVYVNAIDHTITFLDWDGSIINSATYHKGDKVKVPANPIRAADNTYTYTFNGWDKTVVNCAGDATYTATYKSTYINYTVTFKNWDGTVLSTKTYHYGETIVVPAEVPVPEGYTFVGWDKEITNCSGNATYTVVFEKLYVTGDLDGNDNVNTDDVVVLLLYISMPDVFPLGDTPADFTGDGEINTDDAVQLLLHISMPDVFPI